MPGLTSLEALKQKLAEDNTRMASAGRFTPRSMAVQTTQRRLAEDARRADGSPTSATSMPDATPDGELPAGQPDPAVGGAKSAASYLRAMAVLGPEDGRCQSADTDLEVAKAAVAPAVGDVPDSARGGAARAEAPAPIQSQPKPGTATQAQQPEDPPAARATVTAEAPQVVPCAPASAPPAQKRGRAPARNARLSVGEQQAAPPSPNSPKAPDGGGGGLFDFDSNPSNFQQILRYMRDGEAWDPPTDPKERALLKREALYFGCSGLLNRMDKDDAERAGVLDR